MSWDDVANKYGTDKGSAFHGYMEHYERILSNRKVDKLFEIGVANGFSLYTWREIFPDALIVGCDIEEHCRLHQRTRTAVLIADAANPAQMHAVSQLHGPFDVVIDDGSHDHHEVSMAFEELYPRLAPGGVYIVEDLTPTDPWVIEFANRWAGELIPCHNGSLIVIEKPGGEA